MWIALALLAAVAAAPAAAQPAPAGWSVQDDAFTDLWFHGLAVVGLHGFGHAPLYDPAYPGRRSGPDRAGPDAGPLRRALEADEAFEVLHFVPLYMRGAGREEALDALRTVATGGDAHDVALAARVGATAVAAVLAEPRQRAVLGDFVDLLDEEWRARLAPARRAEGADRAHVDAALQARWNDRWAPALAGFLVRENLEAGTILVAPALGVEGRFLEADPQASGHRVVAVARPRGTAAPHLDEALASVVREFCYPVVRRAFGPLESRAIDRVQATRVSDLAATRCGELLLERAAPDLLVPYRARFALSESAGPRPFLAASGLSAGVAALERPLEAALLRELDLDDERRAPGPGVRRIP